MMYGSTADLLTMAYQAHAAELRRFAGAKVRDPEMVEDIVHEAYLRLAVEGNAGRWPGNPRAWLYRVAANEIISRGRRATTAARWVAAQPLQRVDEVSPESRYLDLEAAQGLDRALRGIGAPQRRGLVLAAEGFSGREIARALGRNEGATRALLCRARKVVRRGLEGDPAWA